MVGQAEALFCIATVVTDKSLCLDMIVVEELLHGIIVLHGYDIVFYVVEEHDVEIAAGRPATQSHRRRDTWRDGITPAQQQVNGRYEWHHARYSVEDEK